MTTQSRLDRNGDVVEVQGSAARPYVLKNIGGVLSCSCPAWRNQSAPIDRRTCKHLKMVRGAANEEQRIAGTTRMQRKATPQQALELSAAPPVSLAAADQQRFIASLAREQAEEKAREANAAERRSEAARKAAATLKAKRDAAAQPAPAVVPQEKAVTPHAAARIAKGALGSVAADRLASGQKLRQDEKAKLFGPPVLLAHKYEGQIDPTGWWMSEKLDGVRAYWDGSRFVTRQGNTYIAPAWFVKGLPNEPLDGELWIGRQRFSDTISIVKRQDAGADWAKVEYVVFDAPAVPGPFEARLARAEELVASAPYAWVLEHTKVASAVALRRELDRVVALGAEGLMLREPGSAYEVGRSTTLLKMKPQQDAEGVVIAHEPGKGRHAGRLGGLVLRLDNGVTFNLGTGLTDAQRSAPPAIGSRVTFRYTELTKDGVPRCAAFVAVRDYE